MNNAAIYTTIDGLFKNYTADTFAAKCHNYVKNDCDLDVGEANDLSWKYDLFQCYESADEAKSAFARYMEDATF